MNGHMIAIYDKEVHTPLLWTHLIPATVEGRAMHNVQNAMFAAALAYNMNIGLEDIRHGLRTFDSTFFQAPGRMNIYNEHPVQGHPRLRTQPRGGPRDVRSRRSFRGRWQARRGARGARRPARRRYSGDRRNCGRALRLITSAVATTIAADAARTKWRSCSRIACSSATSTPTAIEVIPDEQEATTRALEIAAAGRPRARSWATTSSAAGSRSSISIPKRAERKAPKVTTDDRSSLPDHG